MNIMFKAGVPCGLVVESLSATQETWVQFPNAKPPPMSKANDFTMLFYIPKSYLMGMLMSPLTPGTEVLALS